MMMMMMMLSQDVQSDLTKVAKLETEARDHFRENAWQIETRITTILDSITSFHELQSSNPHNF